MGERHGPQHTQAFPGGDGRRRGGARPDGLRGGRGLADGLADGERDHDAVAVADIHAVIVTE